MSNILRYKGYQAKIEYNTEDALLIGTVVGLQDTLLFDCSDSTKAEQEFHLLIDDYLDLCKRNGKNPEKAYKGSFNVRISPELHRQAALKAHEEDISLNEYIEKAIAAVATPGTRTFITFSPTILMNAYRAEPTNLTPKSNWQNEPIQITSRVH